MKVGELIDELIQQDIEAEVFMVDPMGIVRRKVDKVEKTMIGFPIPDVNLV